MLKCLEEARYSHHHLLTREEVWHVLAAFTLNDLTPFVFSLQPGQRHALYHGPLKSQSEHKLADLFEAERQLPLAPLGVNCSNFGKYNKCSKTSNLYEAKAIVEMRLV